MEAITNAVSSVATTASKLVYGDQTKTETDVGADNATRTATNETGGKEPISGEQGTGTVAEPYDQGNAATPLASTATRSTFLDYRNNETAGQEPVSGEQGKGTVTDPFDQGNDAKATGTSSGSSERFLKLDPALDGPKHDTKTESSGAPKIYTNRHDETYAGMPIVPLNPDVATSGPGANTTSTTGSTGITDKAGVSDKVWKDSALDDISRSGAPGAGPSAPDHVASAAPTSSAYTSPDTAIKTSAPDGVTAASSTYPGSGTADKTSHTHGVDASQGSTTLARTPEGKVQEGVSAPPSRDTPGWATTDVPSGTGNSDATSRLAGESSVRKSESGRSHELGTTTSNDEKSGKMSALKDKLKDKLHIGSKDK